jgi:hypothetical protein
VPPSSQRKPESSKPILPIPLYRSRKGKKPPGEGVLFLNMNSDKEAEVIIESAKMRAEGSRSNARRIIRIIASIMFVCLVALSAYMAVDLFSDPEYKPSLWLVGVVLFIAGAGAVTSSTLHKTNVTASKYVKLATYLLIAVAVFVGYGG